VGGLQARSLGVTFADRDGRSFQALSDVAAAFPAGALTAIVGPSGSGKSTLLHALAGIVLPQQGEVACGDVVVNRLAERQRDAWRLAHCGMVFQDFRLLDELDALGNTLLPAQFAAGQLTAIVGPSGSGKSTLLHALAGIVLPQQGEVACGDVVVNRLPERRRDAWRLANCGMVFQDFRLLDELDALGNTLLPAQFDRWSTTAALRERAQGLLARFEVPLRSGPVARLSRGEQQRVALARALLLDPPLILADEPTASLDADNGQRIAQELRALAAGGKTVVAVTHDDKLMALADRVLTLRAGRIQ
jgi:putative ABC transport system ATP-binding protein